MNGELLYRLYIRNIRKFYHGYFHLCTGVSVESLVSILYCEYVYLEEHANVHFIIILVDCFLCLELVTFTC